MRGETQEGYVWDGRKWGWGADVRSSADSCVMEKDAWRKNYWEDLCGEKEEEEGVSRGRQKRYKLGVMYEYTGVGESQRCIHLDAFHGCLCCCCCWLRPPEINLPTYCQSGRKDA